MPDPIRPVLPGRFPILLDNETHTVALGNVTQIEIILHHSPTTGEVWLGILGIGCWKFSGYATAGYVQEKFKCLPGDAGNIADLINSQLSDLEWSGWEPQGRYDRGLTHKVRPGCHVTWEPWEKGKTLKVVGFESDYSHGHINALLENIADPSDTCVAEIDELTVIHDPNSD